MGCHQSVVQKTLCVEIFGRQAATMRLNSCDLALDLIEMNGCDGIQ